MKIYFLSSERCALYINGAYFGITDGFERSARIALQDGVSVQFVPQGKQPLSFFLTEEIRFTAPPDCRVYLLKDGIAIYAERFHPVDCSLRVILQKRLEDTLITVYAQGELHLSVNVGSEVFVATLPPTFAQCTVEKHGDLLFLYAQGQLAVYTLQAKRLLWERVHGYAVENGVLSATLALSDSLGRVADCKWNCGENELVRTQCTLRQSRTHAGDTARDAIERELIPYAFFESVLIGANYAEMLSDELVKERDKIKGFLGDFTAISPTDEPQTYALFYPKAENVFQAQYYTVRVKNGKIEDITKL